MAKRVPIAISAARKQLFHLADLLRKSGDDTVVVLEQRGGVEPVAMVREARLAYLEAKVEQMNRVHERPFTLAGSLKTHLSEDAIEHVFRELRKGWTPRMTGDASPAPARRGARRRK